MPHGGGHLFAFTYKAAQHGVDETRRSRCADARGTDGLGITVSYWATEADIKAWKANIDHLAAQRAGAERWYEHYAVRIAKVERAYGKR